jgi:hypothetical protein
MSQKEARKWKELMRSIFTMMMSTLMLLGIDRCTQLMPFLIKSIGTIKFKEGSSKEEPCGSRKEYSLTKKILKASAIKRVSISLEE